MLWTTPDPGRLKSSRSKRQSLCIVAMLTQFSYSPAKGNLTVTRVSILQTWVKKLRSLSLDLFLEKLIRRTSRCFYRALLDTFSQHTGWRAALGRRYRTRADLLTDAIRRTHSNSLPGRNCICSCSLPVRNAIGYPNVDLVGLARLTHHLCAHPFDYESFHFLQRTGRKCTIFKTVLWRRRVNCRWIAIFSITVGSLFSCRPFCPGPGILRR